MSVTLETLEARLEELRPAKEEYMRIWHEVYKLRDEKKKQDGLNLIEKTKYIEPEYPDMGVSERNGSARFESEEQATQLQKVLASGSYYFGYEIDWSGPGNYVVVPSYSYDHDNEVIYTATFERLGGLE